MNTRSASSAFARDRRPMRADDGRPKNLRLISIRLPLPALVSILHRVSGVLLFLCLPVALWLLLVSFERRRSPSIERFFTQWQLFGRSPFYLQVCTFGNRERPPPEGKRVSEWQCCIKNRR